MWRNRRALLTITLLLVSSTGCAPAVTLDAKGFVKIPLRAAVVISKADVDWAGSGFMMEGPAQPLFGSETKGYISAPAGGSTLEARSLHTAPVNIGGTTYKIETPLKCYDASPKSSRILKGGNLEPIHGPHYQMLVSYLRAQAENTLRQNLPAFFTTVEFFELPSRAPAGYDLLVEPRIVRWPGRNDAPNSAAVTWAFTFREPGGRILRQATVVGTAPVKARVSGQFGCRDAAYQDLMREYRIALAHAQAQAIATLFSQTDLVGALRSYVGSKGQR